MVMKIVWPKLVILGLHGRCHCTRQKVQMCVPLAIAGGSKVFIGILSCMVVRASPR